MATSEIRQKSRTRITAQTNYSGTGFKAGEYPTDTTWNTSGNYYGGTPTVIDNTFDGGTENGLGAMFLNLELDVTDAPATAATAEIWYSTSEDGTNYTLWKYSHTISESILTTANRYAAGLFELTAQYTKLAVAAISYDIDAATLYVTPKLYEAQ